MIHVDNLALCLQRGGLHAPNHCPRDSGVYRTIHNADVQSSRHVRGICCGPGGTAHDYVPFYFGTLSVMLLNLKTGRVAGYSEGQEPLLYLQTTAQTVAEAGLSYVFTDGHALARWTEFFDDLAELDRVDWGVVGQRYWKDTTEEPDRQRRKQAEFLVHRHLPWGLVERIGVYSSAMAARVQGIVAAAGLQTPVVEQRSWYY